MRCATVINGIISFPIAILAYFCLPDTPGTAKPNWLFTERVSSNVVQLNKEKGLTLLSCHAGH